MAGSERFVDRFEVEREVGRGASGVVFRAHHRPSGRVVALKVVRTLDADAGEVARLAGEGALLSGLRHSSIVEVIDHGDVGDSPVTLAGQRFEANTPYVAMEWLEGGNLAEAHAAAPLELRGALECVRQIAAALAVAHAAGVAHRDVKPSNIFVASARDAVGLPSVKLLDFGIASADPFTGGLAGGTPAYMSPEQARGELTLDVRCDVYSLGATLFELCVGRPPHASASPFATLARLVSTPAPRLSEVLQRVPGGLDALVAEMLSIDWRQRPTSAEVERRLAELVSDPSLPEMASIQGTNVESPHSSASRMLTTLVALKLGTAELRDARVASLCEVGAEAFPLGKDAVVAFFGLRMTRGGEGAKALELGKLLTAAGAAVGVATGRAQVQRARPVGEVVEKASALAREAQAGQLLADDTTVELARAVYDFEPLSDRPASSAWVVGRPSMLPPTVAHGTPFVGRDVELATLTEAFLRCVRQRLPVAVSVSGPPGIGKSRLAHEFLDKVDSLLVDDAPQTAPSRGMSALLSGAAREVRRVRVGCDSYARARALGTAGDALAALLELKKGARASEVEAALVPFDLVHGHGDVLARLLAGEPFEGSDDEGRARDLLYPAMTELTLKIIGHAPCILAVEDVHWSDAESIAWFDHLLQRAAGRALCIVAVSRPSFRKEHPNGFRGKGSVEIELRPISRQATMEIAKSMLRCPDDDEKLERIARQAAGSPLFAEELARVTSAGREIGVVPTIEAAIQSSLDALDGDARDAVTRLSVFGLAGWDRALAAVGVAEPDAVLSRLLDAEIVTPVEVPRFAGLREVRFKHALVRDVAYATAGDSFRAELHAAAAAWLATAGDDAATVAEHYDRGGLYSEAAGYWEIAARRALAANALRDACTMADRALTHARRPEDAFRRATLLDEIHSRLDERAAERAEAIEAMRENATDEPSEVRTMGASARFDHARSGGVDVEGRLIEVVRRARELGLVDEQARCVATLAARHAFAGEFARAEADAEQLLLLGEAHGVASAPIDAWQTLAVVRQARGELASALDARRNAAAAARRAGLKNREAMLTINVGFALTTIGARDEARRAIEDGVFMAAEVGSTGTVRLGRMLLLGWVAHFGADAVLDEELSEARARADEAAAGGWVDQDRVTLGVLFYRGCELLRGDASQLPRARALLSKAALTYRATGNRDVLPVALGCWAEAERRLGEPERAEELALEAAELLEGGAPCLLNEAIVYLALHGARLDRGNFAGAENAIGRAMPAIERRLAGLKDTTYARFFLRLSDNAKLLDAAEALGCVPSGIEGLGR